VAIAEAAARADIVTMLIPGEVQDLVYLSGHRSPPRQGKDTELDLFAEQALWPALFECLRRHRSTESCRGGWIPPLG